MCALGCFSKDTLKKNQKPNPVRNWGVPRENISRRRGWSDKSRGSLKTLEVWQKCMLDKTSHLLIIRQTAAEQGLRKLIIDIILTIVWYWVINFLKKMFKNATGWSHGVRKAFLGGWRQAQWCQGRESIGLPTVGSPFWPCFLPAPLNVPLKLQHQVSLQGSYCSV